MARDEIDFDELARKLKEESERAQQAKLDNQDNAPDPVEPDYCNMRLEPDLEHCNGWVHCETGTGKCPKYQTGKCPQHNKDAARSEYLQSIGFGNRYAQPDIKLLFGGQPAAKVAIDGVTDYIRNCRQYVEDGRGVMLLGGTGIGKTFAFALIALAARKHDFESRYVYGPNLFDLFYNRRDDDAKVQLEIINGARLLLLDDIGSEYGKDYVLSSFNSLIEARHGNKYATCIASNMSLDELCGLPGYERAVSRWYETCAGKIFNLSGEVKDLRRER